MKKKNIDSNQRLLITQQEMVLIKNSDEATNVDLHIGSDCVRNFTDIMGIKQQKKRLSQLKKEQEQQKRKIDFEVLEGEDLGFIEDAENKFNNFPILLPHKLYSDLKDRISQIALLKSAYIKNGGDLNETFSSYCSLKSIIRELFTSAEHYHSSVVGNPLLCEKHTAEWLLKNNRPIWEMVSKNGGIFCADTLKKVCDERYVSQKIMLILRHMQDKDLHLLQVSKLYIHFSIKNERYIYPVTFTVPISYFMEHIGCYALTDKEYTFNKESLSQIVIESTSTNFHALYNSVFEILKHKGYDFIIVIA